MPGIQPKDIQLNEQEQWVEIPTEQPNEEPRVNQLPPRQLPKLREEPLPQLKESPFHQQIKTLKKWKCRVKKNLLKKAKCLKQSQPLKRVKMWTTEHQDQIKKGLKTSLKACILLLLLVGYTNFIVNKTRGGARDAYGFSVRNYEEIQYLKKVLQSHDNNFNLANGH